MPEHLRSSTLPWPQIFIFIGETLLSMNWAIVADILLVSGALPADLVPLPRRIQPVPLRSPWAVVFCLSLNAVYPLFPVCGDPHTPLHS